MLKNTQTITPLGVDRCEMDLDGRSGGARRDRTDDLKLAKLPLSQLSYGPAETTTKLGGPGKT
jgi:hypothetical protein